MMAMEKLLEDSIRFEIESQPQHFQGKQSQLGRFESMAQKRGLFGSINPQGMMGLGATINMSAIPADESNFMSQNELNDHFGAEFRPETIKL